MESNSTTLKVIRLLQPSLCLTCRFGVIAQVTKADHSIHRMLHCKRLDCDNWQMDSDDEQVVELQEES